MHINKDHLQFISAFLIAFFFSSGVSAKTIKTDTILTEKLSSGIYHYHVIQSNTSEGFQNIHIVAVNKKKLGKKYICDLINSDSLLISTADEAKRTNAVFAVNGGFFDVRNGGSVSYVEYHGKKVSARSMRIDATPDYQGNINAAILADKIGQLHIESARHSSEYLKSENEVWVLVAGPLLYLNSMKCDLNNSSFVTTRHPRTLIAETSGEWLFITIDGRHPKHADGMSLTELQNYLNDLGTINAINLDGGGSTTMWVNSKSSNGIINCPSDNKKFDHLGERKVANALLILKK